MSNKDGKTPEKSEKGARMAKKTSSGSALTQSKSKADRLFEKAAKETYSKRDKRVV